jgi:hypothetical protein
MDLTADKALELVFLAFNREATPEAVIGYSIGLEGMSGCEIVQACRLAMKECKFMPTPRELRDLAGKGNSDSRAILAWDCAVGAAGHGPYKPVDFSDKLINATIRSLGGWPSFLSRLHGDEEKWCRQEFIKTYCAYQRQTPPDDSILPLPGLGEMTSVNGVLQKRRPIAIAAPKQNAIGITSQTKGLIDA